MISNSRNKMIGDNLSETKPLLRHTYKDQKVSLLSFYCYEGAQRLIYELIILNLIPLEL